MTIRRKVIPLWRIEAASAEPFVCRGDTWGEGEAAGSIDQSYEAPGARLANSNSVDGINASGPAMVHVAHHARVIECLSSSNSVPREAIIFRAPTVTTGSSTAMAATIISRVPAATTFSRAARAPT